MKRRQFIQYYAEQRIEVAQAFIDAIEDAVYRIRESPTRYIVIDEDVRRCMTRKFPYGILYTKVINPPTPDTFPANPES